ncbi:MAG: Ldh family oxidoreductase [Chloroflexi bacterium]|nr:Ldh family oxidoreductase [Chloroflexota bacterium]
MLERFKVPEADRVYVKQERARKVTEAVLRHSGVSAAGARASAEVLITNDLRGVESHGVSNGLRRYVRQYANKELNPRPRPKILKETSTTARVDGDLALGTEVGAWCMNMAIEKARQHGIGAVSLMNTGHLAGCGYYAYMATENDMIGHMMTAGGGHQTLPTFGAKPLLGTNPIAWAAPARKMPPFLLDVATTQVAGNKIELARRTGHTLFPGWIAKKDGTAIMEEVLAPTAGTYYMLPFGGTRENGSHKAYGLAVMNEIMCNELSSMGPGPLLEHAGGSFFAAYSIEAFTDLEKFKDDMDRMLEAFATCPPAPGFDRVLYPGLSEHEEFVDRTSRGIPYHREVVEWFESYCAETGIECELR